jgi:hypothetical protein
MNRPLNSPGRSPEEQVDSVESMSRRDAMGKTACPEWHGIKLDFDRQPAGFTGVLST